MKKWVSIIVGWLGFLLLVISLESSITGNIVGISFKGLDLSSKIIGAIGILLMIVSVFIENYELRKITKKNSKKRK